MATNETIKQLTAGGVTRDIEDTEARAELLLKANSADVYTKDETDTALAGKANTSEVVKSITVNGTAQTKDAQGNVNINVEAGESVVVSQDEIAVIDNPASANANSSLAAGSARWIKEIYLNLQALYSNLAGIAFTGTAPTWQSVAKPTYTLSYGTLTGCTADVAAGTVNEGALRIKLTPTQASYAFTSVTVNGESVATTATGDADGSVYLDIVVNGNITVAATAISGRAVNFSGTGCTIDDLSVAISQDLDTTIRANSHYTLPASITVEIGNANVTHTYTKSLDGTTATLHIDAADITGDLAITCAAEEDAHVVLDLTGVGSNVLVKLGNDTLADGDHLYNSSELTISVVAASGYKMSAAPTATIGSDAATISGSSVYEAYTFAIGTSVANGTTVAVAASASALGTFNIDLTGLDGVTALMTDDSSAVPSTILEGSELSITLSKTDSSASGSVIIDETNTTMANGTLTISGSVISTNHVTGNITIAASVGVQPMKVHSYTPPYTTDENDKKYMADDVNNFRLYNQADVSYSTNNYPSGYYANGKDDGYRVGYGGSSGYRDLLVGDDFTVVLRDVAVYVQSGQISTYDASQIVTMFYDRANVTIGNQGVQGQFQLQLAAADNAQGYTNATTGIMRLHITYRGSDGTVSTKFYQEGSTGYIPADRPKISGSDTRTHTYHVVMSYNNTTKKATAWVVDTNNETSTKELKLCAELDITGKLILPCIAMKNDSSLLGGLDVYNYAMSENDVKNEFSIS